MNARRLAAALLVTSMAVVVGCGSDTTPHAKLAAPRVFDIGLDAAAGIAEVDLARPAVLSGEQFSNLIDQQLAWHGVTLGQVMRTARAQSTDVGVWIDQLRRNTADLTATIGFAYGPDSARAFNQQWAQHTQFLVDYAVATGAHDTGATDRALAALSDFAEDSASLLANLTAGELPAGTAEELLAAHIAHMTTMLDADQAGDTGATVAAAVADSTDLSIFATDLSAAIAVQSPTSFPGSTATPLAVLSSIVTAGASGYLSSLLITGDPSSSAVLNADQVISQATGVSTASVIGLQRGFAGTDALSTATAARSALSMANAFVLAHPPASP